MTSLASQDSNGMSLAARRDAVEVIETGDMPAVACAQTAGHTLAGLSKPETIAADAIRRSFS
jgi:hypothetical protein